MTDADALPKIAWLARELYTQGPVLFRALQHYRPYICPFEILLEVVPKGSRVLDIGCGGGLFLGLLSRAGRISEGFGIDANARAISLANLMATRLPGGHRVSFEVYDAATPLPPTRYDVVSLLDVMHHIHPSSQRAVLEQAIDRVSPGGLLVYKDMARKPLWRALANRMHDLILARQWIHYVPLEQVIDWAESRGCVMRRRWSISMLWYGHEIAIFERSK